jgi:hypothetical protein
MANAKGSVTARSDQHLGKIQFKPQTTKASQLYEEAGPGRCIHTPCEVQKDESLYERQ